MSAIRAAWLSCGKLEKAHLVIVVAIAVSMMANGFDHAQAFMAQEPESVAQQVGNAAAQVSRGLQARDLSHDNEVEIARLSERIAGIERSLVTIESKIDEFASVNVTDLLIYLVGFLIVGDRGISFAERVKKSKGSR